MNILIEHIAYQPYTGKITGGSERSTYLAIQALRQAGHQAEMVVPADSIECEHLRSAMPSKLISGSNLKPWYRFMADSSERFDAILLNHPLISPVPFGMPEEFLRKCTYINRNGSSAYVTSAMGMRLLAHLKLLRHCGGRTYCLSAQNKAQLERQWLKQDLAQYCSGRHPEAGRRLTGNYSFLETDMFDGRFNEAVCPDDLAEPLAGQGYVVTIGRADKEKRLTKANEAARRLGKQHLVFTTNPDEYGQMVVAALLQEGAEVFIDVPHHEIMAVLAGADGLILSSRNETYCHVAMEAVAHGVPVMALEVPPAMDDFPEMVLSWALPFTTTSLEERVGIQRFVQQEYSLLALGQRLGGVLRR